MAFPTFSAHSRSPPMAMTCSHELRGYVQRFPSSNIRDIREGREERREERRREEAAAHGSGVIRCFFAPCTLTLYLTLTILFGTGPNQAMASGCVVAGPTRTVQYRMGMESSCDDLPPRLRSSDDAVICRWRGTRMERQSLRHVMPQIAETQTSTSPPAPGEGQRTASTAIMPLDRPIPAFYCCYLLRSTIQHGRVYVGSTPNPVRRLRQHNGLSKGGAARTNRDNLRPWEMTCLVTGFPSHIAALQFEWAWQNPHVTLHIPPESRIQHATQKKRSGQPKRPRHTVTSLLSSLHLLLRVPSFSRWPLDIRFFNKDVHKAWLKWVKVAGEPIRDSIPVISDFASTESASVDESVESPGAKRRKTSHGIDALVVDYAELKEYSKKTKEVVDFEREGSCSICHNDLDHGEVIYTICPSPGCETATHLTCLSKHFLKDDEEALVPIKGNCPSCKAELRWVDIVKELTLRMRGQKEVEKLLKVKKTKKGKTTASQAVFDSSDIESDEYDEMDGDIEEELKRLQEINPSGSKMDMKGDTWHSPDVSEDSDTGSTTSQLPKTTTASSKAGTLGTVIEDSDWDDALVLD